MADNNIFDKARGFADKAIDVAEEHADKVKEFIDAGKEAAKVKLDIANTNMALEKLFYEYGMACWNGENSDEIACAISEAKGRLKELEAKAEKLKEKNCKKVFCTKCGAESKKTETFCSKCGEKLKK